MQEGFSEGFNVGGRPGKLAGGEEGGERVPGARTFLATILTIGLVAVGDGAAACDADGPVDLVPTELHEKTDVIAVVSIDRYSGRNTADGCGPFRGNADACRDYSMTFDVHKVMKGEFRKKLEAKFFDLIYYAGCSPDFMNEVTLDRLDAAATLRPERIIVYLSLENLGGRDFYWVRGAYVPGR